MTLEAALHARWSTSADLLAIVPADRFLTGYAHRETALDNLPCVMLTRSGNIPLARTSRTLVEQANVRLQVWSREHAQASEIRRLILQVLNAADWVTASTHIVQCRLISDDCLQEDDDVWQWILVFEVTYQEPVLWPVP
jgi:hypothetical protein